MNDAVKMALEALTDIRTSIECATGCDEGIDPMAAVSEIMSAYGTAMASAYSRAADMLNILAALEQAGEPVACVACDDTPSAENNPCAVCGKRLGQEFDAGEAFLVDGDAAKHMRALGHIKDTIPSYMGDAPKAQHYQALHAALDAGMDAIQNVARQSRVAAEPVGLRALLDRAELAWQRFFYPAADNFHGPTGDKLPSVDLEVADCLRLVLAELGRHVVTPEENIPALATPTQPDPQSRAAAGSRSLNNDGTAQSRGQAFDCELPLKFDPRDAKRWWEDNMRESKFVSARLAGDGYVKFQWRDADESGDYSVPWTRIALWLAALSSAKRGEEG